MAILCDACGKVITTIHLIRKDDLSFCSYRCYKKIIKLDNFDYTLQKKGIEQELLGISSNAKPGNGFLPEGDISGNSMVRAANFERMGEYKKAINCWKRIQLLHKEDQTIIKRTKRRIKALEKKLLSKSRGLKEGSSD